MIMGMMGSVQLAVPSEKAETPCSAGGFLGAEDGIRTRDPHLGKVMVLDIWQVSVQRLYRSEAICDLGVMPFNTPRYPSSPVKVAESGTTSKHT
jgi:hypothetical protein